MLYDPVARSLMPYRAVLFDLFRTVVLFTPRAPTGKVKEPTWRSAMEALRTPAAAIMPGIDFDAFLDALVAASEEVARQRPPEHFEVPVAERYRRALARLGCTGPDAPAIAEQLSALQMAALRANAEVPAAHRELLVDLSHTYRLGLVSNFDHGPTAHATLADHAIDQLFATVQISIDFGRRKPHPTIFRAALQQLGVAPSEALFVGDSAGDDVGGAHSVGMDSAWINAKGKPLPAGAPQPTYVLSRLPDLREALAQKH